MVSLITLSNCLTTEQSKAYQSSYNTYCVRSFSARSRARVPRVITNLTHLNYLTVTNHHHLNYQTANNRCLGIIITNNVMTSKGIV